MSKKGQNNIIGVEAQQWAALSLFLQYLSDPQFDHIRLEPSNYEDFNLIFRDDRKIICESKYRKRAFSYSHLRGVLKTISSKYNVKDGDAILIVCRKLDNSLVSNTKMIRYFPEKYNQIFRNKQFSKREIVLLPKVKFWVVSSDFNKGVCYALLEDYAPFWIPQEDLKRFSESLKVQFNELAKRGASFSRGELNEKLKNLKKEIIRKTNYYDSEKRSAENMIAGIISDIDDDASPRWAEYNISALSTNPHLFSYLYNELQKTARKLDLKKWSNLWEPNRTYGFAFKVFKVFQCNLDTSSNRKYVLEYIKENVEGIRGYYRFDYFIVEATKIIRDIIAKDRDLINESFQTLKSLLAGITEDFLYVKDDKDQEYQKKQIGILLLDIYDKANRTLQNEIITFIFDTFDLISDHGEHYHRTPDTIFTIVYRNLIHDLKGFKHRFKALTLRLAKQHDRIYGGKFKGWDEIGTTGGFWGRDYRVRDKVFIEVCLKASLLEYYGKRPKAAWLFIKDYCVVHNVSKKRPDFLNRAAIPVILEVFRGNNKKMGGEAFDILQKYILAKRGIPSKYELIYQNIRGDEFTAKQKWQLIKVSLDKYTIPITPFIEQMVTALAISGHSQAREVLKGWFGNPEYFKTPKMLDYAIPNIEALIENALPLAIALFEKYISNKEFIHKEDEFDTYDAAAILQKILERDYAKGLEILNELIRIQKPTINQQILISHGFFHHRNPNDKEDTSVLARIYKDYVEPNLRKFCDHNYLTHTHSRASFLQFARKLAISKLIGEALIIVKAFVNDPDPYPPGKDPEDAKGEFSEQKRMEEKGETPFSISSVRGWCAWALASCPAIPSRAYVPEIIGLTKQLLDDPDWYVRHMACFSLSNLARNRLSVMPPKMEKLYLNDDKAKALKMAKSIEEMAFGLMKKLSKASNNIQKAMAKSVLSPFEHIRALNQEDANRFLDILSDCTDPVVIQAAPFLIYLAEFRKCSYAHDNPKWQMKDYYDDLKEFDDTRYKRLLEELISEGAKEVRSRLSWELWALVRNYEDRVDEHFPIALKYLQLAAQKYEHSVFENIYRFIDDCIDIRFEECFSLWKKCLETEKSFFDKHFDPYNMYWWPHHYNGRILLTIKEQLLAGDKAFIECLKFLSSYPEGARLEDLREAVEELIKMPSKYNKMIGEIFDNLINKRKEVSYCDLKDAWENKKKK